MGVMRKQISYMTFIGVHLAMYPNEYHVITIMWVYCIALKFENFMLTLVAILHSTLATYSGARVLG